MTPAPMRISTTTLESFRLFMQSDQEWMSEDDMIASILRTAPKTKEMLLGTAFGKILEKPDLYLRRTQAASGPAYYFDCLDEGVDWIYSFSVETMAPALKLMDRKRGVFEVPGTKAYPGAIVVARADQMRGARLFEHKSATKGFAVEKYLESYQWRLMVDIFEPMSVTYYVFELDDHGNGVVEVKGAPHVMNLYPYPGITADCAELVAEFVDYVTRKGLAGTLRARQADAEAV